MSNKIILTLITILFVAACIESSSGPSATTVKIYKSDDSIQCEYPGIPLSEMEVELTDNGIDVISSNCGFITGVDITAMCGTATLQINIYEINVSQLNAAEELGFNPVSDLQGYQIVDCTA